MRQNLGGFSPAMTLVWHTRTISHVPINKEFNIESQAAHDVFKSLYSPKLGFKVHDNLPRLKVNDILLFGLIHNA